MPELFNIKGHTGQILFDGFYVTIQRKGFLARAGVGKGEKRIPLPSITAIQWKPAGGLVNGFIQFTLSGGNERRSAFGSQTIDAAKDENSVVFTKKQMPDFDRLRHAVEQAMAAGAIAAPVIQAPPADLFKLAELHAAGILTDEEFSAAKAKALGI
jgi:hypothetical protein